MRKHQKLSVYDQRRKEKAQAQKAFRNAVRREERRVDALLQRLTLDRDSPEPKLLRGRDGRVVSALMDARHNLMKALREG